MKNNRYDVMIYYGTMNFLLTYARDCNWTDAQTLLRLAVSLGYTDAKIIEQEKGK